VPEPRVLVVTPTYNEIESLERVATRLLELNPTVDVLVVDDGSPDGTGELADRMAAADPRVHVLHRTEKGGLGPAYLAGFAWGMEQGYDVFVEMDADGSHPADTLPAMLARLEPQPGAVGLVIGSRWVPGGRVVDWPIQREILSRGANVYARAMLGLGVRDITAGYRAYRRDVLERIVQGDIDSRGYCFQIDMTIRTVDAGFGVAEVPITFVEREAGVSKMSRSIVVEAMLKTTGWGLRRRFGARRG
jgi:dolichol-phosphate mannosyltransferase